LDSALNLLMKQNCVVKCGCFLTRISF